MGGWGAREVWGGGPPQPEESDEKAVEDVETPQAIDREVLCKGYTSWWLVLPLPFPSLSDAFAVLYARHPPIE